MIKILENKKGALKIFFIIVAVIVLALVISVSLQAQNETVNSKNTTQNQNLETNASNSTITNLTNVSSNSSEIQNETNKTSQPSSGMNGLVSSPKQGQTPKINISLVYPKNIIRGNNFEVSAKVSNIGTSNANFSTLWNLPAGFKVVTGKQNSSYNTLESNQSKIFSVNITPSLSSHIGDNEIKFEVLY